MVTNVWPFRDVTKNTAGLLSVETSQAIASREIRLLAKTGKKNNAFIAEAGAIPHLFVVCNSSVFSPSSSLFCTKTSIISPSPEALNLSLTHLKTSSSSPASPSSPFRIRLQKPPSESLLSSSNSVSSSSSMSMIFKRKRPARLDIPVVTMSFRVLATSSEVERKLEREGDCAKPTEFVAQKLEKNIIDEVRRRDISKVKEAVKKGYMKTDAEFLKEYISSGTCCVTALIHNGNLIVSNAGDCRAVMRRCGVAKPLTSNQRPSRDDERNRIQSSGGYVEEEEESVKIVVNDPPQICRSIIAMHLVCKILELARFIFIHHFISVVPLTCKHPHYVIQRQVTKHGVEIRSCKAGCKSRDNFNNNRWTSSSQTLEKALRHLVEKISMAPIRPATQYFPKLTRRYPEPLHVTNGPKQPHHLTESTAVVPSPSPSAVVGQMPDIPGRLQTRKRPPTERTDSSSGLAPDQITCIPKKKKL
ncbi:Phosphatase 2C family protein isoform 2 [Hibiscus syriacus]|uniref:Phosphatase 2C family protein isoform 2 n=1 Tax=Hibiscus syriacus TaxID=106335 RepID=A0A6A2XD68_HIBSY|nr:Phosphatase 2C family protein isoform 2 [Hibiscus syriacus]